MLSSGNYSKLNFLSSWPNGKRKHERNRNYKDAEEPMNQVKHQGSCSPTSCLTH